MVGAGAVVGLGVGVEIDVARSAVPVGEETTGVGDTEGGKVGRSVAVALGVAIATAVGTSSPDSCEASRTPASTVTTETRPTAIPLHNWPHPLLAVFNLALPGLGNRQ